MLSGFSSPALLPCRCLRGVRDWAFFRGNIWAESSYPKHPGWTICPAFLLSSYGSATLCILNHWYSKFTSVFGEPIEEKLSSKSFSLADFLDTMQRTEKSSTLPTTFNKITDLSISFVFPFWILRDQYSFSFHSPESMFCDTLWSCIYESLDHNYY